MAVLCAADDRRAAAILRATHHGVAARLITELDPPRAGALLARLTTDRRIEILSQLEPKQREALEQGLSPEDQRFIQWTLSFPEGAVARHLSPSVWQLEESATVRGALQALSRRRADRGRPKPVRHRRGQAGGRGALREVAVANPDARLDAIMVRDPISVRPDTELSAAAEIIQTHEFLSLPATDAEGKLLGAVRVDDLLDAVLERAGTAVLNQCGVAGKVAGAVPCFLVPIHRVVRSRITWLILLFVAETLTGTVLRAFEDELAKVVALSFFVPLIIGTGGNAGSQTVSSR